MLILLFGFSFLTCAWASSLTIRLAKRHAIGADETVGVQKFHRNWTPRLGGIPMFIAVAASMLLAAWATKLHVAQTCFLLVCVLPAFGIGLLEDITRNVGVATRLLVTVLAAGLGWWLLGAQLHKLDLPGVDHVLALWPLAALALTLFAVSGVVHAVNIMDGYNGLSSFHMFVALAALAWVAQDVGDPLVYRFALLSSGAILGFLVWNFPRGLIFMGDSGAYLLGFLFAELAIMLVVRNPIVSPWCPLLLMSIPVWETLFSMARRVRHGVSSVGQPDALHLHHLIYRRLVKRYGASKLPSLSIKRNSLTSVYYWLFSIICAVPAVLFADRPKVLMALALLAVMAYLLLYRSLVRFSAPKFMMLRPAKRYIRSNDARDRI